MGGGVSPTGSFGGSKQSGESATVSPYAALAAHIGKQIEKEVDPLRSSFLNMLLQVVQQGGSAVGTPLSNEATAASMEAGSQAEEQTAADLARSTGGTANPVGSAILASQRQQSGQATSAIPTDIGSMLLGMVNPAVGSAQGGVSSMIGQAIAGNQKTTSSQSGTNFNLGFQPQTPGPVFNTFNPSAPVTA